MNERLTIHDIHKRLRGIHNANKSEYATKAFIENASISIKNRIPKDIMKSIEIAGKYNSPVIFESVLDLFDTLYECGTTGQLNKMCNYICEEVVPKIRDSKEANTNLRRKLGRIKSKITTKVSNNIQDAQDEIKKKLAAVKGNFQANTSQIKDNVNKGLHLMKKNEAYIACYESMINALSKAEDCDRILENYDKISRRFNLEKLIIENTRINDYLDTVNELCSYVETYDMPNIVKFNTVLETAWYGFEQNGIDYEKEKLIDTALNHFLMKENGYDDCKKILENTTIFKPEDLPSYMQVITEINPEDNPPEGVFQTIDHINDEVRGHLTESSPLDENIVVEGYDFNKIFNDFKKENSDHKETKLNMLVTKLYSKNVNNIVEETPNFLNWIRHVFVLGGLALHPVIGAVIAIGNIFARLHFERNETEKMIKCFDEEIKKTNAKLKSTKNQEEQARLKDYLGALKKAKSKVEEYYEKMLTDKELDAKYSGSNEKDSIDDLKNTVMDSDFDDDDFNWDDDDEDGMFEAAVNTILYTKDLVDDMREYDSIGMNTVTHMSIFNAEDLDSLAKLSVAYPDVWSPELMENAINNQIFKIRKGKVVFESAMDRFQMINSYDTAKNILSSTGYPGPRTIRESLIYLECLREAVHAVATIIDTHENKSMMVEASFTNSLKMASEKLKKTMVKLSDKDKTMSKNIDVSLSQFKKSMENAVTNDNREAVIKGSVLPSASKMIKLAITTGGLWWLIDPVVAVITALGYLALSAKHKAKERQLILDELDVELKMCEKYIDIAESKNDMKSLKQLLTIQKNLKRQEQRIRYKMKVDFNQNAAASKIEN